eukprot:7399-Heterococcus_DN1.PRE.2
MFRNFNSGTSLCTSGTSASRSWSPSILPVPSDGSIRPIKPCSNSSSGSIALTTAALHKHKVSACSEYYGTSIASLYRLVCMLCVRLNGQRLLWPCWHQCRQLCYILTSASAAAAGVTIAVAAAVV